MENHRPISNCEYADALVDVQVQVSVHKGYTTLAFLNSSVVLKHRGLLRFLGESVDGQGPGWSAHAFQLLGSERENESHKGG